MGDRQLLFQDYLFEVLASYIGRFRDFLSFGNTCQQYRRFLLKSNRWLTINPNYLITDNHMFKLAQLLNQYWRSGYKIPFVETLILDGCFNLTEKSMSYVSNAYLMSKLRHLSLDNCTPINNINGIFKGCLPPSTTTASNEEDTTDTTQEQQQPELQVPKLESLKLPTLTSNTKTIQMLKNLSSITSLSLPGSIESFIFLRFLESCPSLTYLSLNNRFKDNLFNKIIVDKLCTFKGMKELHLYSMSKMLGEDVGSLAMNLVELERLSVTNNQWLSGSIVNLILESCTKLRYFDISQCREVSNINSSHSNLLSLDLSFTGESLDIYFPNLHTLSIKSWKLNLPMIETLFSRSKSIVNLDLSGTLINDEQLLPILKNCNKLVTLNLDRSDITVVSIENILKYCSKHLTKLILTSNSHLHQTHLQPLIALGTMSLIFTMNKSVPIR